MDIPESVSFLEEKLLSVPWPLYAGLELISAVLILLNARAFRRYRKMHLDANAIRHTVDLLPTGILIGDGDGAALRRTPSFFFPDAAGADDESRGGGPQASRIRNGRHRIRGFGA